jgi:hypothetical protein
MAVACSRGSRKISSQAGHRRRTDEVLTYAHPSCVELQRKIVDKHLVISQVPIVRYSKQHYRANRYFFPERNATMSALTSRSREHGPPVEHGVP